MRAIDPTVQAYLDQIQEQKRRGQQLADQTSDVANEAPEDYSPYAALAKASAALGTVGGKSADTSAVSDSVNAYNQQAQGQKKMQLASLDNQANQLDKDTGLNLKTLEYLQNRQDLAGVKSLAPKALSQDQTKAAGFAQRVAEANAAMDKIQKGGYDRSSYLEGAKSILPTSWLSPERQEQEQAERNFVNTVLRDESGSAISSSEFDSAREQYFPRAGDNPGVLALKAQSRQQALNNLLARAGGATGKIETAQLASAPSAQPSGSLNADPMSGETFTVQAPNGALKHVPKDKLDAALAAGGKLMGN